MSQPTGSAAGPESAGRERLAKVFIGAAWTFFAVAILGTLPRLLPWLAGALWRNPEAALLAAGLLCLITSQRLRGAISARRGQ